MIENRERSGRKDGAGERKESRRFSLILAGALLLWGTVSLVLGHPQRAAIFGAAAIFAPLLAWGLPAVWIPMYRLWLRLTGWLAHAITIVLLSSFFFLLLTPVSLVARLFGRSAIDLRWGRGETTAWCAKAPSEATRARYRRPF